MTNEKTQKPKTYEKGEQIWYLQNAHCPYVGMCPAMSPSVQTARVMTVLEGGQRYMTGESHTLLAHNVFATREAALAAIPDSLRAKITALKDRLAELETMLEKGSPGALPRCGLWLFMKYCYPANCWRTGMRCWREATDTESGVEQQ